MQVDVTLTNRFAWIACDGDLKEELRKFWSYYAKGYFYNPKFKLRQRARAIAEADGLEVDEDSLPGWDGRIRLFSRGKLPAGLFRATRAECEEKLGIEFCVNYELPDVDPGQRVVELSDAKYQYQDQCVESMVTAIKRGGGIVLAATRCLDGDTYIDIPRDLVKHPHGIKIRELVGRRPWVYCYNHETGSMDLVRSSKVWRSGVKVPVYKVTFKTMGWKGRGKRSYEPMNFIVGTADHKILLRKTHVNKHTHFAGDYIAIKDLQPGDRVMPFFRRLKENVYSILNLNNGEKAWEHRFVLDHTQGYRVPGEWDGHHRNEHKLDNTVNNLEWKTNHDHHSEHTSKRNLNGTAGWLVSGVHPRGMKGKRQTEHQKQRAREWGAQRREKLMMEAEWRRKDVLQDLYHGRGMTATEIAEMYGVKKNNILQWMHIHDIEARNNHIVEKVEFVGYRDVYDIEVPKHHNFVANGIVVHNSGKTRMSAKFFRNAINYHCLFVVDQVDLLYQNAEEIEKWLGETVGIVGDKTYTVSRVTVATIQTLHKHVSDLKFKEWFKKVKIVVVDELHDQLNRRNFDVLQTIAPIAQYGLTATLQLGKKDVRSRAFAFAGPVIFRFPMAKGIETGVLVEGRCIQLLFPSVSEPGMPYKAEYSEQVVNNTLKIKTCKALVSSLVLTGRYVMVLVERVRHLDQLSDEMADIHHYVLCGDVKQKSRVKSRQQFESGDIKVLIANKVMKKGITLKRLDAVIEMAELKSPNDVVQKFGRGLGLHEDKSNLIYVDIGTQTGRLRTAAKSRKKALVTEGVQVEVAKVKTAMEAVNAVNRFLNGNVQMKLFGS